MFKKEAAEEPSEWFDSEEEVRPSGNPSCAVGREAATRHDTMDMGMVAPTPTIP
jgi:hypothetical protein